MTQEALQVIVRQKNKYHVELAVNVIIDDSAPRMTQEALQVTERRKNK